MVARMSRSSSSVMSLVPVLKLKYVKSRNLFPDDPEPRSGHRIVVDNSNLYSIGGYNPEVSSRDDEALPLLREVWKFNFASKRWQKLRTQNMPSQVASHSAIIDRENILIFGGSGMPFGQNSSNQLYLCNVHRLQWIRVPCKAVTEENFPEEKYGHTMTLVGDHLYICGGTSGFTYNMDVHCLNIKKLFWSKISRTKQPAGRYRHETGCDGKYLYIFGGGTATEVYTFQQIAVFDLQKHFWKEVTTVPDKKHGFPRNRRCHACVQFKKDIYISGGIDGNTIFGDIWKFSLTSHEWTKLAIQMAEPVYFHSAAVTHEGCMYIFGGVVEMDRVRTNSIYTVWLQIPSLREMCWQYMCNVNADLHKSPMLHLLELGIPENYLQRLVGNT